MSGLPNVTSILNRVMDPVYLEYLALLKTAPIEFNGDSFMAKRGDKFYRVKMPVYAQADGEGIESQYIRAMASRKMTSKAEQDMVILKKLIGKATTKEAALIGIANFQDVHTEYNRQRNRSIYYVKKLPVITLTTPRQKNAKYDVKKEKKAVAKASARDEKIKEKVIGKMMTQYPFNMFKFSNKVECSSRESSKPFYISKKDMVEAIANNPELAKIFPKGYKSMKKEDLCETLFQHKE